MSTLPANTDVSLLSDYLAEGWDLDLDEKDLRFLFSYYQYLDSPHLGKGIPAEAPTNKGVLRIAVGAALGFVAGGPWGAVIGALGAYLNQPPKAPDQENQVASAEGFSNVGQKLIRAGEVLSVAHGNAIINENGGVRFGGHTVFAEIYTLGGQQFRKMLYLGPYGRIGAYDVNETLLDEQPITNYVDDEVEVDFRNGAQVQTVIPGYEYYSHVVRPKTLNELALDLVAVVDGFGTVETGVSNLDNATNPTPGCLFAEGNVPGFGTSGGFGVTPLDPLDGGDLSFSRPAGLVSVGLSSNEIDLTQISPEYSFNFTAGGNWEIVESGVVVFTSASGLGNGFRIRIIPGVIPQVVYIVDGAIAYTSTVSPSAPLFFDVAFGSTGAGVCGLATLGVLVQEDLVTSLVLDVEPHPNEDDVDDNDAYERFNRQNVYFACPNQYFKVVSRNDGDRSLVVRPAPEYGINGTGAANLQFENGQNLYSLGEHGRIIHETTKRVGGPHGANGEKGRGIIINMEWNLHAFDDDNKDRTHAIVYDVHIRRTDQANFSHLIRLYTRDNLRRKTFTGFEIDNLELGRYVIRIDPVICECNEVIPGELPPQPSFDIPPAGSNEIVTLPCLSFDAPGSNDTLLVCIRVDEGVPDDPGDPNSGTEPRNMYIATEGDQGFAVGQILFDGDLDPAFDGDGFLASDDCTNEIGIGAGTCAVTDVLDDEGNATGLTEDRIFYPIYINGTFAYWVTLAEIPDPYAFDPDGDPIPGATTLGLQQQPAGFDPANSPCPPPANNCLDAYPIYHIDDFGFQHTINTAYDSGLGSVRVTGEINPTPLDPNNGNFRDRINFIDVFDDKVDISSKQGPVGRLTFVSEQVNPAALGKVAQDLSMPGWSQIGVLFKRDTQTNLSFLGTELRVVFNHLAAGESGLTSTPGNLVDFNTDFIAAGIVPGMILENMWTDTRFQITGVTQNTLQYVTGPGDEFIECRYYRAGFEGASPYLPDVLVDYIMSDIGIGNYFPMPDLFIDWRSMVNARQYCVANGYFYDLLVSKEITFREWIETQAIASQLIYYEVGGLISLKPNIVPLRPNGQLLLKHVFNSSNGDQAEFSTFRQESSQPNRLIVTIRDGRNTATTGSYTVPPGNFDRDGHKRGRPRTVIVETREVTLGLEPPIVIRLELSSVTNEYQAIEIGAYYLKTQRSNIVGEFATSFIAAGIEPGDWVSALFKTYQLANSVNGYVCDTLEPFDPVAGTQCIVLSECPVRWRDCGTFTAGAFNPPGNVASFVRIGDVIRTSDGTLHTVNGVQPVNQLVTVTPPLTGDNISYEIWQMDFSQEVGVAGSYETETVQVDLTAQGLFVDGKYCIRLSGLTEELPPLSPVTIANVLEDETQFLVTSTSPQLDGQIRVRGIQIREDFYLLDGLTVVVDDAGIEQRYWT